MALSAMLGMQVACLCSRKKCIPVQSICTVEFLASNKSSGMGVLPVKVHFQENKYKYITSAK